MKVDLALRRVGGEVRRNLADLQHPLSPITHNFRSPSIYHFYAVSQDVNVMDMYNPALADSLLSMRRLRAGGQVKL